MYHFVMCIMHECRLIIHTTIYIYTYDIDLVPNLERRGHYDTVHMICILTLRTYIVTSAESDTDMMSQVPHTGL